MNRDSRISDRPVNVGQVDRTLSELPCRWGIPTTGCRFANGLLMAASGNVRPGLAGSFLLVDLSAGWGSGLISLCEAQLRPDRARCQVGTKEMDEASILTALSGRLAVRGVSSETGVLLAP